MHAFQKSALWSWVHFISRYFRYVLKLTALWTSFAQALEREEKQWRCRCVWLEESFLLVQGKTTASSRGCWLLWTAGMSPEQHRLNGFLPTKKETSVLTWTSLTCIAVLRCKNQNSSWGLNILLMYSWVTQCLPRLYGLAIFLLSVLVDWVSVGELPRQSRLWHIRHDKFSGTVH